METSQTKFQAMKNNGADEYENKLEPVEQSLNFHPDQEEKTAYNLPFPPNITSFYVFVQDMR